MSRTTTVPKLSPAQVNDLKAYHSFYEPHEEEMNLRLREDLKDHHAFGPLIKNMPEELQREMNKRSREFQRGAIWENKWEAYIENLTAQGVGYAQMNIDFKSWYEVLRMVREYIEPALMKEFGLDITKAVSITRGMDLFFDIAMGTIGEAYIKERNEIIEKESEGNKQRIIAEREQRMNTLMIAARDAIITANRDSTITGWNPAAETVFGWTAGEAIGQQLTIIMPKRFHEAHLHGIKRFIETKEPHVIGKLVELAGIRKDGTEFPLELSLGTWQIDEEVFSAASSATFRCAKKQKKRATRR